jgi:hypothetical protein
MPSSASGAGSAGPSLAQLRCPFFFPTPAATAGVCRDRPQLYASFLLRHLRQVALERRHQIQNRRRGDDLFWLDRRPFIFA